MKQFQYTKPSGAVFGPFTLDEARGRIYAVSGWQVRLPEAEVGDKFEDSDGDVWTRVADLDSDSDTPDEPGPAAACQAERLERITTAVLQGILSGPLSVDWSADTITAESVRFARKLIAELDRKPHPNPFVDEVGL